MFSKFKNSLIKVGNKYILPAKIENSLIAIKYFSFGLFSLKFLFIKLETSREISPYMNYIFYIFYFYY